MNTIIPFNKPGVIGNEILNITQVFNSSHIAGDGFFTHKCHEFLETNLGISKALLTTSCTHALEMAALLLNIKPGDEFIVPSFTFVTTANAFVLRGAKPIFIDVRTDTLNMDEAKLESMISPNTKAILPVHYAGVGCEMDTIMEIANKYDIPIVEDNAHGLFGKYKGKYLGTFGKLATQSFHETKNFSCGEGGALLINDPQYKGRAEIIREKGTDRSRFFRGEVNKYGWVDVGSSYLPSEILAAVLYAQFEAKDKIQSNRKRVWEYYFENLEEWANDHDIRLPIVPDHCEQTYHVFYILLPSLEIRHSLIAYLKNQGIQSVFHYLPLHLSKMGMTFGGKNGDCPVTEDISDRLLRLPLYPQLTNSELDQIVTALKSFFE